MADTKLTALTALTAPAIDDLLYGVDKSDTTDDAAGSSRKMELLTFLQYTVHGLTEIAITDATTAPTIGRMHVYKATSADRTVVLPTAASQAGKIIGIRITTDTTKLFTFDGNSTETIDGALTRIMWAGESAYLMSDGSNWFKIAGKSIPLTCKMSLTADQTLTTGTTWYFVALNTATLDAAGMCNTGSNRIDIKRPGRYAFDGNIIISSAGGYGIGCLELNSSSAGTNFHGYDYDQNTVYPCPKPRTVLDLVAGDHIKMTAQAATNNASVITSSAREYTFLTATELTPW